MGSLSAPPRATQVVQVTRTPPLRFPGRPQHNQLMNLAQHLIQTALQLLYRDHRAAKDAGVRRRCYGLTAKGVRQLGATRREWDVFFHALSRIGGLRRA